MTIVNHYFANVTDRLFVDEVVSGMITAVPRCLVVHEHVNLAASAAFLMASASSRLTAERLFHHDVNAVPGTDFHDTCDDHKYRCKREQLAGARWSSISSRSGKSNFPIEAELLRISSEQRLVRFGDANNFDPGS